MALEHKTKVKSNCKIVQGSIEKFPLDEIINEGITHIIHAARISGNTIHERFYSSLNAQKANQKLLDFIEQNTPNTKITYLSGSLVYGDCEDTPVFENQILKPTAFAREYALAELPFQKALSENRLQIQICRPAWIIGDNSWFRHFYLNTIFNDNCVLSYTDKNPIMNIIALNDCARLICEIAMNAEAGMFNLSSPIQLTKSAFLNELSLFYQVKIKSLPLWKKWFLDTSLKEAFDASIKLCSNQKLVNEFDFQHSTMKSILKPKSSIKKSITD